MSPVGARRALGSSIMDGSCLAVGRSALQGACAAFVSGVACVRQSLQGALSGLSAILDPAYLSNNLDVGVRNVNRPSIAQASPPIGPPGVNFFPYFSIQLPQFGDHFWGGDHSLSSGWKVAGGDAVVALGRGCALAITAGRVHPE